MRASLLLLLLAIGPLQAQAVIACAMMDTVMHDECCCDDHKFDDDCANEKCDFLLESGEFPCFERSVEVSVDQEASQHAPLVKPTDTHSDVDPPQGLLSSIDAPVPPESLLALHDYYFHLVGIHSGSDTYLVTQRLRI